MRLLKAGPPAVECEEIQLAPGTLVSRPPRKNVRNLSKVGSSNLRSICGMDVEDGMALDLPSVRPVALNRLDKTQAVVLDREAFRLRLSIPIIARRFDDFVQCLRISTS